MIHSTRSVHRWLVTCLVAMLAQPEAAFPRPPEATDLETTGKHAAPAAETPATVRTQEPARPLLLKSLRIMPLEGDHTVNYIPAGPVTVPAIAVHNDDEMPVEGATVVFQLPSSGPGGHFPEDQLSLMTQTNSRGQAIARGFRPNSQPGRFPIRVTASFKNLTASYVITQTNSTKPGAEMTSRGSRKWLWVAIAGGAAAAAAGLAIGLRSDSPPSVSASVGGPIVIGAP